MDIGIGNFYSDVAYSQNSSIAHASLFDLG
jgi:hypothetical protein